jgi:hypothetical protein
VTQRKRGIRTRIIPKAQQAGFFPYGDCGGNFIRRSEMTSTSR